MTNQARQKIENRQEVVDTSSVYEFYRMKPSHFTGSSITEDPEKFIVELNKVFEVMHVVVVEREELQRVSLESGLTNGRKVELRVHKM